MPPNRSRTSYPHAQTSASSSSRLPSFRTLDPSARLAQPSIVFLPISKLAFTRVKHLSAQWNESPLKPDAIDTRILEALMDDGRASFRQIAQRTALTTPTVSARVARMMKAGLIKKFVPVLSADSVDRGVLALVTLKTTSAAAQRIAGNLAELRE